jgi:Tfp pilus assembly protein PilO
MSLPYATSRSSRWLREPVDIWSDTRLAITGAIAGLLVFVSASLLWHTSDMSGMESAQVALHDAQERLVRARLVVGKLPALRASSVSVKPAARWTIADALRDTSLLAAQSGVRIGSIEPATQKGEGLVAERPLRLRAEGSFSEIQRFLQSLDTLPRLVIPADVQIKRGASALSLDATLRVFEELPPVTRSASKPADASHQIVASNASDPFDTASGAHPGEMATTQLVGTLRDRRHALALLQTAEGVDGFTPGVLIDGERLGRVRSASVDLTRRDGAVRTLALQQEAP